MRSVTQANALVVLAFLVLAGPGVYQAVAPYPGWFSAERHVWTAGLAVVALVLAARWGRAEAEIERRQADADGLADNMLLLRAACIGLDDAVRTMRPPAQGYQGHQSVISPFHPVGSWAAEQKRTAEEQKLQAEIQAACQAQLACPFGPVLDAKTLQSVPLARPTFGPLKGFPPVRPADFATPAGDCSPLEPCGRLVCPRCWPGMQSDDTGAVSFDLPDLALSEQPTSEQLPKA